MYNMAEIEYRPIKKIVAHEIMKKSFDEFINLKVKPQNPNVIQLPARWIDGIVFTATAFPATPELVNEEVAGTIHWAVIEFAEMQDYQQMLTNQNTGSSLMVTDYSSNTAVVDFIRWLKKQPQWFGVATAA